METFNRVFLSYAARDANHRSLLLAASRAARLPVRFVEMPNHVTDPHSRRVLCLSKLQQCDLAIVLASPHALRSASVAADLATVREAGVPVHVFATDSAGGTMILPPEWEAATVIPWHWPRIAAFLQRPQPCGARLLIAG